MREAHAWHGDRRHHAPDAAADTPASRAHDSPSMRVLRDPAAYPASCTGRADQTGTPVGATKILGPADESLAGQPERASAD